MQQPFRLLIFLIQPYMFQATNSPILTSTFWLYIQPLVQCTDTASDRCIVQKLYIVKKCSWGWANLSPETCRAELKRLINEKAVASCWLFTSLCLPASQERWRSAELRILSISEQRGWEFCSSDTWRRSSWQPPPDVSKECGAFTFKGLHVGKGKVSPLQALLWLRGWALEGGWVLCSMPRRYFTPGKDPVPIVQEAGWAPGPFRTGGKSRPTGIRSPDRPARSQSLYRLSYPAHSRV